jgi:histone arginine demethylase JMJD6
MSMSMEVARCRDLSRRDFARRYLAPSPRPVILTDALSNWGALGKWTPDYFGEHYGDVEVTIDGRTMSVRELAAEIRVSSPEHPAPYLRNSLLSRWPAPLRDDVTPLPRCTEPNWLDSRLFPSRESLKYFELYIGGRGAAFPVLHYDGLHTHAFIMEIYGEKEFWVYPPEQTAFVYPRPGPESNKSQIDDIEHPDLERFPLFAQAKGTRFRLKAGETLFVPAGWWHTTRVLTAAISVSVNSADAANWRAFNQDFCTGLAQERGRLRAAITSVYLGALGGLYSGLEFLNLFY